jgi:hypothetical protein
VDVLAGDHHIVFSHQQKCGWNLDFIFKDRASHFRIQIEKRGSPRSSHGNAAQANIITKASAYSGFWATSSSLIICRTPGVSLTIVSAIRFSRGLGTVPRKTKAGPRLSSVTA